MTPRPNFAGYVVLAAFVAAFAYVVSGKAAERVWVAVKRGQTIVPGLAALWDGPSNMKPDHYDQDSKSWRWLAGTPEQKKAQMTMMNAGDDVLVEAREPT